MERLHSKLASPLLIVLTLLLGGFSVFVGWNKAFAPLDVLREHSAWTIHLPVMLGRLIGLAELVAAALLAAALLVPRTARWGLLGAGWISANHVVAGIVHVIHREWHTLTQTGVVLALCALWLWLWLHRTRSISPTDCNHQGDA